MQEPAAAPGTMPWAMELWRTCHVALSRYCVATDLDNAIADAQTPGKASALTHGRSVPEQVVQEVDPLQNKIFEKNVNLLRVTLT